MGERGRKLVSAELKKSYRDLGKKEGRRQESE